MKDSKKWIGTAASIVLTLGFLWLGSYVVGSGFSTGSK
jgi:hypothetical protein